MAANLSDRIDAARDAVLAQIGERNSLFPEQAPAPPWDLAVRAMSYVFTLPSEQLRSIRLHCDWFLGENTPVQLFAGAGFEVAHAWLGEGVDPALWAYEPVVPALDAPLGHDTGGKAVNLTTLAIQRYLCNLLRLGLADGQHIVEIGAGYGGLAYSVMKARDVCYTIIDLPETLIFSAAFLMTNFPDKRIYVYTPGDGPERMKDADIVLLPTYRADWIEPCDFAINTVSFPEMDRESLTRYLDLIHDRLKSNGMLVSINYDYNPRREDGRLVTEFLAERFDLYPGKERILAEWGKAEAEWRDVNCRPTMVCTKPGETPPKTVLRDLLGWDILVIPVHPEA